MTTLQSSFEAQAAEIMNHYQDRIKYAYKDEHRLTYLKEMQAELMQLKATYQGLVFIPSNAVAEMVGSF